MKESDSVLQAASLSAHAVTIQRMSRKPTCCKIQRLHPPPEDNCREENCLWKGEKPLIKDLNFSQ